MKKSNSTDRQCLKRILRYIGDIQQIFEDADIKEFQDLKKSLMAKYATTQVLTNIYELSRKLQDTTLGGLTKFNSPILRTARQIASHNYEAIDFKSIYSLCMTLTGDTVRNELEAFLEVLKDD